jgi:ankyrin repeat protein
MAGATKPTRLGKKLIDAIYAVDLETARALVADGADVHYVPREGGSNVAGAAARLCNELFVSPDIAKRNKAPGFLELLRQILAAGAKLPPGPFQNAAAFGNVPLFESLLEHGVDVNELNDGTSAIYNAVLLHQEDIAADLLRRGANPWLGEPLIGRAPALHEAAVAGLTNVVRACVENNVDLNRRADVVIGEAPPMRTEKRRDASGRVTSTKFIVEAPPTARGATPLMAAVQCGNREIVQLLVEGQADLEAADADGFTPLAWALKLERVDLADILRAAGAKEVASLDGSPLSALIKACKRGDVAAAEAALARRPNLNATHDEAGERFTPLMHAAQRGHDTVAAALLAAGADPNQGGQDKDGFLNVTPLMLAAVAGHANVVRQLIEAGAQLDAERSHVLTRFAPKRFAKRAKNTVRDIAIEHAAEAGQTEVVKLLLEAAAKLGQPKAPPSVVEAAAASGNTATMKAALNAKKKGRTAAALSAATLVAAVESGNLESVRELVAAKANVNGRTRRDETPLSSAVARRDLPMVELLLDAGARPAAAKGKQPMTELMMAAAAGDANIAKLLLDAGADPDIKGNDGDTALHLSAMFGFPEVVELLVAGGASTAVRNDARLTPLKCVTRILAGWIGKNPDAPQYKCRDLLQRAK